MKDQKQHWEEIHAQGEIDVFSQEPTAFAQEILSLLPVSATILELGCGAGNDSGEFAREGHKVTGTDFSDVAIRKNAERFSNISNLTFQVLDMNTSIKFTESEFDLVYARLSLHYFTDSITKRIFNDIHRILKSDGLLAFLCKSTQDPLYGRGEALEKDMYEYNGHVRHFFSEEYARSLLAEKFRIEQLVSGEEELYGRNSAFVKVLARAVK